jgi:hypothetical protein
MEIKETLELERDIIKKSINKKKQELSFQSRQLGRFKKEVKIFIKDIRNN